MGTSMSDCFEMPGLEREDGNTLGEAPSTGRDVGDVKSCANTTFVLQYYEKHGLQLLN